MDTEVSHRELAVWKAAITLASKVYGATADLPSDEPFGLGQQLRRAAVAVPTSIAEGSARANRKEFIQALRVARGSLAELETHLIIAGRQQLVSDCESLLQDVGHVARLLTGLMRTLSERRARDDHLRPMSTDTTSARRPHSP